MTDDKSRTDACLKACEGISTQNLEDNVPFLELARRYNDVLRERDALRAKVDAMERQEPVMWVNSSNIDSSRINRERGGCGDQHTCSETQTTYHDTPLYALPGAQPAPSVPEDVMRDAERYRYLRARDDDTAGVGCWIEADGRACDRGWLYGVQLDSAIDSFIEVLAAAPKPEGE